MLWALFGFVYIFMPNTRVRFKSGLLAGILAGTLYLILQWAYIRFQIGVTRYDRIYGGFAVLPLLLLWLQVTWMVVLFGAEVSFAIDNEETYEFESECLDAVLDHLAELTEQVGFFTIHTGPAGKVLPDGRNAHLIQQPPEWWLPKIQERFELKGFNGRLHGFEVLVLPREWDVLPSQDQDPAH